VATIQAASSNMQYMKLEGPPILALPEKIEPGERTKHKGRKSKTKESAAVKVSAGEHASEDGPRNGSK